MTAMLGRATAPAVNDDAARERAVDSPDSVLVRAPAGSGKTALLVQRYLRLLSLAERPEEIVAVTFTRKAAEEMRTRVLGALASPPPPEASPYEQRLAELAAAARARAQAKGWNLEATPSRLRITTLDALALQIVRAAPWQGDWSAISTPTEDAHDLYFEAARATLARLEHAADRSAPALHGLLEHLLADYGRAERELVQLLEKRDQWLGFAASPERGTAEAAFAGSITAEMAAIAAVLAPHGLSASNPTDWQSLTSATLTNEGKPRQRGSHPGLPPDACAALQRTKLLPQRPFTDDTWNAIFDTLEIARLAYAELKLIFGAQGRCDFTEITLQATDALEQEGVPTGLAARLDAQIRHIFVDEFQDTSRAQLDLLHALVADWSPGDGRTLFLVGDAMQSIYGFRNAQVWLFQDLVQRRRLGPVALEVVDLSRNFRSSASLVEWTNAIFAPSARRLELKEYLTPARSALEVPDSGVTLHPGHAADPRREARAVVDLAKNAVGNVAILGYSRGHLAATIAELEHQGVAYQGVKLRSLAESEVVRDLLALTRALAQPADRAAWLAVLRAPWCGLLLNSLHQLCAGTSQACLPTLLLDPARRAALPEPERQRLEAVLPALLAAANEYGRQSVRVLVGACWRRIEPFPDLLRSTEGGAYLDWLQAWEDRNGQDLDELDQQLSNLTAPAPEEVNARIQVMTIHTAKGREFDTVILPALSRQLRAEAPWLLRWDGARGLLAAQAPATSSTEDPHHAFLGASHVRQSQQEQLRLLYVAATRARRQLHLFASFEPNKAGEIKPRSASLLGRLWPELGPAFAAALSQAGQPPAAQPVTAVSSPPLQRVRIPAGTGPFPAPPTQASTREPGFQPDLSQRLGTAVHAMLQSMGESGQFQWQPAQLRLTLRRFGIAPFEMQEAEDRARQVLESTVADPRGRWILAHHQQDRWEWELADANGNYRLDRGFVADGERWIVDFKTSATFSTESLQQYEAQLSNYARLVWEMDRTAPIRCALYFPMLPESDRWHEVPVKL